MGRAVFTPGYHDHALDIAVRETPDRPPLRVNDDTFHQASPGEAMLAERSSLSLDWLTVEDGQEAFAALRALPAADKQSLFAACIARTLKGQLAFEANARPETEATVARLDIEFAAHVRLSAEMFWSRIRKDRMLAVARDTLGVAWAQAHAKDKKTVLADAMESAFAAGDGVPEGVPPEGVTAEGHATALAWAPPGFNAFDTGRVDDGDDDGPAPPDEARADTHDATASEPAEPPTDSASAQRQPGNDTPATPTGHPEIDAMNAVPVFGGGPRVIVNTVGFESDGQDDTTSDAGPPVPPAPGNGHGSTRGGVPHAAGDGGDALEIPAFLRRS